LDSVGAQWVSTTFGGSSFHWQLTWMGGQVRAAKPAVYGTLGFPAAANIPGGRSSANGGQTAAGISGSLGACTRMITSATFGSSVPLRTMGLDGWKQNNQLRDIWVRPFRRVRYAGNTRSRQQSAGRVDAASWIDSSGNFWLFGGLVEETYGNTSYYAYLNDLWSISHLQPPYRQP